MAHVRSQILAQQFEPPAANELRPLIAHLLRDLDLAADAELANFLSREVVRKNLPLLRYDAQMRDLMNGSADPSGHLLADIFAVTTISNLAPHKFSEVHRYPAGFSMAMRAGAASAYGYGKPQYLALRAVADRLANWCSDKNFRSALLIDSPLGGSLPTQVIARILEGRGIATVTKEFRAPRRDRGKVRYSIRQAALQFAANADAAAFDMIVYADDAITGTRYTKVFGELRRAFGAKAVLPVVLRFRDPFSNWTMDKQRSIVRLSDFVRDYVKDTPMQTAPFWTILPPLPLVKVDDKGPVSYASPVAWGEADLFSGKRKVGLLFGTMEQIEDINHKIASKDSATLKTLNSLWSDVHPRLIASLCPVARKMDWSAIWAAARTTWPNDYTGSLSTMSVEDVEARFNWVKKTCRSELGRAMKQDMADVLINAIDDLYSARQRQDYRRPDRDRDYCEATFHYNGNIRLFNKTLVDLITA